ncbi:DUF6887 family protein [Nostoc sp.]|uniref:DUF6887 family protein n=1 Tax=Nostoc sp. TaxID=1180 RepID=UPI002FF56B83
MSKENFQEMTHKKLKEYILNHRTDEDAIHEAVLRLQRNGTKSSAKEFIEIAKQRLGY